jgi:hypothetical protein
MPIETDSGYLPDWLKALLGQGGMAANAPAGLFSDTAASPSPAVGLLSNLPQFTGVQPSAPAFQGGNAPNGPLPDQPPTFSYMNPNSPAFQTGPAAIQGYPSMTMPQDPGPMNVGPSGATPLFGGVRPDAPFMANGPTAVQDQYANVPLPPRRPNDLASFQAMAPAGAPQEINTPPAGQPNSNVVGTQASGAPEVTAQQAQGPGFLSKASDLIGGIYGAGGPGDALIALGLSNRTNGASIQALNAMTAQRAAVDNKAYKDLLIAQAQNKVSAQNSFANNSYKYLLGKGVPEPTATAAINAAQQGNNAPLNDLFKQFESRDEYRPLITPEERAAQGIRPTDTAPYRLNTTTNKLEGVGGGGTTINNVQNPIMATIGEQLKTTQTQAVAAANQLRATQEAKAALDAPGGIITGFRAGDRLSMQKFATLFGVDPTKVQNTETFRAAMKPAVLEIVKGLGSGVSISNADRAFAEKAAGGDIDLNEGSIRSILNIAEAKARYQIEQHNKFVDKISGASGEAQPYAESLKVDVPTFNKPSVDPLAAARDAIARGAPREAVLKRLRDNNIDTSGL